MKEYLFERLREPSTWRGLIWVCGAFGVMHFSQDQESAITALAMALAGAGGILPDNLKRLPTRK